MGEFLGAANFIIASWATKEIGFGMFWVKTQDVCVSFGASGLVAFLGIHSQVCILWVMIFGNEIIGLRYVAMF